MKHRLKSIKNISTGKKIAAFLIFAAVIFTAATTANAYPENTEFKEFINSPAEYDIVIILSYGGWGTPSEEQNSLIIPVAEGTHAYLQAQGYETEVIPYKRLHPNIFGKFTELKEITSNYREQSVMLASQIENYREQNPDTKIILLGLSNGAGFMQKTFEKLPPAHREESVAIELGRPFWAKAEYTDRVLLLDNKGRDPLATGDVPDILKSAGKAPMRFFRLALSKEEDVTMNKLFRVEGHDYPYEEVMPVIRDFLDERITGQE